jgi:hypothetical protein
MRFESIAEKLLEGGVLPRHVRRYIGELEDHFAELTAQLERSGLDKREAELRARARLGDETELVSAMLELPNLRAWSARAPWLIFVALPPIITFIAFFLSLGIARAVSPLDGVSGATLAGLPVSYEPFVRWFVDAGNLVIAPAVSAVFAVMVVRQRLNRRWALLAALSIAIFDIHASTYISEGISIGHPDAALWMDPGHELLKNWRLSTLQALLTLLPAALLALRRHHLPEHHALR